MVLSFCDTELVYEHPSNLMGVRSDDPAWSLKLGPWVPGPGPMGALGHTNNRNTCGHYVTFSGVAHLTALLGMLFGFVNLVANACFDFKFTRFSASSKVSQIAVFWDTQMALLPPHALLEN